MEELEQGQGEDLVVIYKAPDEFTAQVIKDLLQGENIPVVLESRQVAWLNGTMKMGEGYWGDVVVPREFAETGTRIIEEYRAKAEIKDTDVPTGEAAAEE